jgi:hypothetical protein
MPTAFVRELLPPPSSLFGRLTRPNGKGWAMGNCCFHKSKSHRSFSVNVDTGAWHCFGCGAHGGDVVSFIMQRDRIDFPNACKLLGAWKDIDDNERRRLAAESARQQQERERALQMNEAEHRLRMGYRSEIHVLEGARRDATVRLGNPEGSPEGWDLLTLIQDELRQALASYYLLSFGTSAEREEFARAPAWRDHAVVGILNRGYIRDDAGHITEVWV